MKKKNNQVSRRKFLTTITTAATAAVTMPLVFPSSVKAGKAKDKLRHAAIGIGSMGTGDLENFRTHPQVEIVALCDVDSVNLKKAADKFPNARTYTDWRELLKKEKDTIDSVGVAVPDHSHYIISMKAIAAGKHVYCQKPMCHDVAEVRALTQASIKKGEITQLGTQHASGLGDRTAVQWIKEGAVGKIKHAYLCSNRPGAVAQYRLVGPRPETDQAPPSTVDWDKWVGTAPMRPFVPAIYHPRIWRSWQDFGTGWSGDIGCHIFDAVWKGLGLKAPKSVIAEVQKSWQDSPTRRADTWPQGDHITWMFPGNDLTETDTLPLEWFDGEFYPPEDVRKLYSLEKYPAESAMLIGTKGALLIPHTEMPILLPQSDFTNYKLPQLEKRNHYHHFVDAILLDGKTESHFAQSGPMTEAILLGTVAIREPGQLLEWDSEKMKFPNYPQAEKHLQRRYRKGWA